MRHTTASAELNRLQSAHRNLETELHMLNRRGHLTPSEQQRVRIIKKEKLRAKDRIRVLMNRMSLD